jgi:hypothetical protein
LPASDASPLSGPRRHRFLRFRTVIESCAASAETSPTE